MYQKRKQEVACGLKEALSLFGEIDLETIRDEYIEESLGELMLYQMT